MKDDDDENQLINYLKATTIEVGLLLNLAKNQNLKEKYLIPIKKHGTLPG